MSSRIFIIALAFLPFLTSCDKEEVVECEVYIDGAWQITRVSKAPEYLDGGEAGLAMAVLTEIAYPAEARENQVEGTVRLVYEVSLFGTVENITIAEDIGAGCGEEAKRAFGLATDGVSFSPAEIDNMAVRARKEIPVVFRLE